MTRLAWSQQCLLGFMRCCRALGNVVLVKCCVVVVFYELSCFTEMLCWMKCCVSCGVGVFTVTLCLMNCRVFRKCCVWWHVVESVPAGHHVDSTTKTRSHDISALILLQAARSIFKLLRGGNKLYLVDQKLTKHLILQRLEVNNPHSLHPDGSLKLFSARIT